MNLQAELEGKIHSVEVRRDGGKAIAIVDGREYALEVSEPENGVYLFKNGGSIAEVFVSPQTRSGEPFQVQTGGHSFEIKLFDPKRLRGSNDAGGHGDGAAEIRTAMPGKVVRILLEAGTEVAKGDGVLVVEAMKMQNELKAPRDGRIKEITVQEGATVTAGDVLAIIESSAQGS
ncbi:MAG: biotin/lipoyl-containing protein [Pyrinomonadaceae bacterium]